MNWVNLVQIENCAATVIPAMESRNPPAYGGVSEQKLSRTLLSETTRSFFMSLETVKQTYIPTAEEISNWAVLQEQQQPDHYGSHDDLFQVDVLSQPERTTKKPLSFNFDAEVVRARDAIESGSAETRKLAQDGFINNAQYWAKEYIGDIKTTHYYWEIEESDKDMRLFHPQFGYADEMYHNAVEDEAIPEYERKRRVIENEIGQILTRQLGKSHDGDTFIWMSPPPEGVENETYGGYTMGHLYEVREVNGKKILAGRDVKNKLSNENHKLLLESYAQQKLFDSIPTSNEILGTLVKSKRGISTRDVERSIEFLEKEQGIREESDEDMKAGIFEETLSRYEYRLQSIYRELEKQNVNKAMVTQMITTWAQDIFIDSETNLLLKNGKNTADLEEFMGYAVARFEERVGGGSCGEGFGFEDMSSQYQGVFGYTPERVMPGIGGSEWKKTLSCTCPFCNQKVEAVIEGGRIKCPKSTCGKSAPYNC